MNTLLVARVVVLTSLMGLTACRKAQPKKPEETSEAVVVSGGDIRTAQAAYGVVFYYRSKPRADPKSTAGSLIERFLPGVPLVDHAQAEVPPPYILLEEESAPLENYPVPDTGYFRHAGRGLTPDDISAVQQTPVATILKLVGPKVTVWELGRQFTEFVNTYAIQQDAYVWDSATRECFTHAAWKEYRLDSWPADSIPDMSRQITIHSYSPEPGNSMTRALTLGMEKFALPDIVVQRFSRTEGKSVGNLINVVCQSISEDPVVPDPKRHTFRIPKLARTDVRERHSRNLEPGATLEATLVLTQGRWDEGDPNNQLVELDFRHGVGGSPDEKRSSILSAIWGSQDSITHIKHSPEILAASERAKAKVPELKRQFREGLPPGDRLLFKAPFKTDDGGQEWMWEEVSEWPGGEEFHGLLANDPFHIKRLRAGAKVTVQEKEIFDYLLYHQDGSTDGNETGKLIEQQSGRVLEK